MKHTLDTQNLKCPEPVMMLHSKVSDTLPGEQIEVLATDPSTERDIPKFCQFLGHNLVSQTADNGVYTYLIERGAS